MMKKIRSSGIGMLFIGIFFVILSVVMMVHDADYMFLGKTVDLNEILKNGGEMPRDKYVTYTCEYPMGAYGTMQDYYGGIIPAGRKSYYYAIYDESGMVFSASANSGKVIDDIEAVGDEKKDSVVLVGSVKTIDSEMNGYLMDTFGEYIDGEEVYSTYYLIDTTNTRLTLFLLYGFALLLGGASIAMFIAKRKGAKI